MNGTSDFVARRIRVYRRFEFCWLCWRVMFGSGVGVGGGGGSAAAIDEEK